MTTTEKPALTRTSRPSGLSRPPVKHEVRTAVKKYLLVAESEYLAQQAARTLGLSSEWKTIGVQSALMGSRFDRIVVFNASARQAFRDDTSYQEYLGDLMTKFDVAGRRLELLP